MIPAGILAEITLHHRDGAYLGQHLTDLGVVVLILRGDRLEEEELFAPGQLGQLFGQRFLAELHVRTGFHHII